MEWWSWRRGVVLRGGRRVVVVVCGVWCVVWCGVVWCGVVWCGVVWCGVVWCGVVWCGVVLCCVVLCGVVVAGWLGRASTTLHCTPICHMQAQETPQCLFFLRICFCVCVMSRASVYISPYNVRSGRAALHWSCITLNENVLVPTPGSSHALV